jgi:hypothetical protein
MEEDHAFNRTPVELYRYLDFTSLFFEVPSTVRVIKDGAFANNRTIRGVSFRPDNVLWRIGNDAFKFCINLEWIGLFDSMYDIYVLPIGLLEIGAGAFAFCERLADVNIDDSRVLRQVGKDAFFMSLWFTNLVFVANATEITLGHVFIQCLDSNAKVSVAAEFSVIADGAFANLTYIETITILGEVVYIGEGAFAGLNALESLTIHTLAAPANGGDLFLPANTFFVVRVPAGSLSDYQNAPGWNDLPLVAL